jgi:hypothetical protein
MSATPGWYPDPYGPGRGLRWWFGEQWTYHGATASQDDSAVTASRSARPKTQGRQVVRVLARLALVMTIGTACGVTFHDPTEGTVTVKIINDTTDIVHIGLCEDSKCRHIESGAATIGSGESFPQNVESRSAVPFSIQVVGPKHKRTTAQCLVLTVGPKVHPQYLLTDLRPCQS